MFWPFGRLAAVSWAARLAVGGLLLPPSSAPAAAAAARDFERGLWRAERRSLAALGMFPFRRVAAGQQVAGAAGCQEVPAVKGEVQGWLP